MEKKMEHTLLGATAVSTALIAGSVLAEGSSLTVFDWSGYEDPGFFASYLEKHSTAPTYTFFGSQEEAFTKLQSGFTADLAHPCSDAVRKWVAADLLEPLDTSKLDNWDAMLPAIPRSRASSRTGQPLEMG